MTDPDSPLSRALAPYVPDFQPHFVNLTAMSDDEIQVEVITHLLLLVLKHIFEQGLGGRLDEILTMAAEVMRQPSGMEMVVALLRFSPKASPTHAHHILLFQPSYDGQHHYLAASAGATPAKSCNASWM